MYNTTNNILWERYRANGKKSAALQDQRETYTPNFTIEKTSRKYLRCIILAVKLECTATEANINLVNRCVRSLSGSNAIIQPKTSVNPAKTGAFGARQYRNYKC